MYEYTYGLCLSNFLKNLFFCEEVLCQVKSSLTSRFGAQSRFGDKLLEFILGGLFLDGALVKGFSTQLSGSVQCTSKRVSLHCCPPILYCCPLILYCCPPILHSCPPILHSCPPILHCCPPICIAVLHYCVAVLQYYSVVLQYCIAVLHYFIAVLQHCIAGLQHSSAVLQYGTTVD